MIERNRKPTSTDEDSGPVVVAGVAHQHDGKSDFHRQGDQPHHHKNGKVVFDVPADTQAASPADLELEASMDRHPAGGSSLGPEPTGPAGILPDVNPEDLTPEQREKLQADLRAAQAWLNGATPAAENAPAVVAPSGHAPQPGASIAEPTAEELLNALRFPGITDPALRHEMNWTGILTRAVVQLSTHHADDRATGGSGPQLAPRDLIEAIGDAYEQIRQPRLQSRDG